MSATLVWVLGKGGLLGAHLVQAITARMRQAECWKCPVPRFTWRDGAILFDQLDSAVRAFAEAIRAGGSSWIVVWAAGGGVVGTTKESLDAETRAWGQLLDLLDRQLITCADPRPGLVFLASSAGGVYGNSPDATLTETSPCVPISDYGRNKLIQEQILQTWAGTRPEVLYLIGRISTLYGPGQNLAKPQGLISHISHRLLYNYPVHIYVPLDTVRDYLYVEDCAAQIAQCLRCLAPGSPDRPARQGVLKVFAAEQATSVAQIVGVFARILNKRHPRVISAANLITRQHPRNLKIHSVVEPCVRHLPHTPLPVGINRLHQYQLGLYRQGRLPAPWRQGTG